MYVHSIDNKDEVMLAQKEVESFVFNGCLPEDSSDVWPEHFFVHFSELPVGSKFSLGGKNRTIGVLSGLEKI